MEIETNNHQLNHLFRISYNEFLHSSEASLQSKWFPTPTLRGKTVFLNGFLLKTYSVFKYYRED